MLIICSVEHAPGEKIYRVTIFRVIIFKAIIFKITIFKMVTIVPATETTSIILMCKL